MSGPTGSESLRSSGSTLESALETVELNVQLDSLRKQNELLQAKVDILVSSILNTSGGCFNINVLTEDFYPCIAYIVVVAVV